MVINEFRNLDDEVMAINSGNNSARYPKSSASEYVYKELDPKKYMS